jgi:uracil-DNA glycosylase family protein
MASGGEQLSLTDAPAAEAPAASGSAAPVPASSALDDLARAAAGCRACDLWERASQTVFGAGPQPAPVMLVGEQPGDVEDRRGAPFVGPAGRILDEALVAAGIDREQAYVTNVVKHFKWTPRGKRRLHQSPNAAEQAACRPWLDAELAAVQPEVLVALGATAAKALLGPSFRVSRDRGRFVESPLAPRVLATVHPSSILRTDEAGRAAALQGLVDDLAVVAAALA